MAFRKSGKKLLGPLPDPVPVEMRMDHERVTIVVAKVKPEDRIGSG
jgi:hypothetical protein